MDYSHSNRILPAHLCFVFLVFTIACTGCNSYSNKRLTIATAANVQFAMDTLTRIFENETGIKTNIILGSSGKLTAQILRGAPYDVFVSADMKYPKEICNQNMTSMDPVVYAYGSLVLWSLEDSIDPDIDILVDKTIRRIAIANPKTAPYGTAALEFIKNAGIFEEIEEKLVYGESVSQVNQFLVSRTADIGFTAKSVVLSPKMKNKGSWTEIDANTYAPIQQGVIIINRDITRVKEAEEFLSFLLSKKAKNILSDFGYKTD